jgi:hypothetical protein
MIEYFLIADSYQLNILELNYPKNENPLNYYNADEIIEICVKNCPKKFARYQYQINLRNMLFCYRDKFENYIIVVVKIEKIEEIDIPEMCSKFEEIFASIDYENSKEITKSIPRFDEIILAHNIEINTSGYLKKIEKFYKDKKTNQNHNSPNENHVNTKDELNDHDQNQTNQKIGAETENEFQLPPKTRFSTDVREILAQEDMEEKNAAEEFLLDENEDEKIKEKSFLEKTKEKIYLKNKKQNSNSFNSSTEPKDESNKTNLKISLINKDSHNNRKNKSIKNNELINVRDYDDDKKKKEEKEEFKIIKILDDNYEKVNDFENDLYLGKNIKIETKKLEEKIEILVDINEKNDLESGLDLDDNDQKENKKWGYYICLILLLICVVAIFYKGRNYFLY